MAGIKTNSDSNQPESGSENALSFRIETTIADEESPFHSLGKNCICDTDSRGFSTPRKRSRQEIVVDASEGFIPLWDINSLLRWRFQERSVAVFKDPEAAKNEIRKLFGEALLQWDDATPIKFKEDNDLWDFEIVVRSADQCSIAGCVLASAFFPDTGRHEFVIYPKMFTQTRKEQIDTFIHEIGHIFGLRHFFAKISETDWPSEIYGTHDKFSIMNYGALSELTENDKKDLKSLYDAVWFNAISTINGTPVKLVKPYSALASIPTGAEVLADLSKPFQQPYKIYLVPTA